MPTTPPERVEFASQAWVDAARKALESALDEAPGIADDLRFSMCESFTGAPPHVALSGDRVAWHARFRGRSVEVGRGEIDDALLTLRGDYQSMLPLGRTVYAAGKDAATRAQRESAVRLQGVPFDFAGEVPTDRVLLGVLGRLHDEMALITVDNADLEHRIEHQGLATHVEQLQAQGYCILERAFSSKFADELRDTILERMDENPRRPPAMLLERGRIFEEAALHPWLMTLAEKLCGKGFLLAQLLGQRKPQGPSALPIHSDYNLVREPFPAYGLNCTAIWALEDFTPEAGPTLVVPRSHELGRHPEPGEGADRALPIEMEKGSIALWLGATWHSQGDRTIPGERVTLHSTYSRLTLRTYDSYLNIDPAILDRNPPELTTLCGLDDVFEKNTYAGPDFMRLAWSSAHFRS